MHHIYLDYAATTPIDKRVGKAMNPFFIYKKGLFGNPGSLHTFGQKALSAMDEARKRVAKTLTANHSEIVFTSSATEASNLVIRGVVEVFSKKGEVIPKIVTSSIEHPAVLETIQTLKKEGKIKAHYCSVSEEGIVDVNEVRDALDETTILVSIMWANNETGTIQPIDKIVDAVRTFRESRDGVYPLIHSDAVQAFSTQDINVVRTQVDFLTLSAHKLYGPKGVGILYCADNVSQKNLITPFITGGGQEDGMRSGTENVAGIVGSSYAVQYCADEREKETKRMRALTDSLYQSLVKEIKVEINGSQKQRTSHILNLFVPGHDTLGTALDVAGVAVSSGSACAQRRAKLSYVLGAMGCDEQRIRHSIRVSVGRYTTQKEIDRATQQIIMIVRNKTKGTDIWCPDKATQS